MKHRALKNFNKHLVRVLWTLIGVYWVLVIHPIPDIIKAIALLVLWSLLFFVIGAGIVDWKIRKYEEGK